MAAGEAWATSGEKVDGRVLRDRVERARSMQAAVAGGAVEQAWEIALRRAAQDMISLRVEVTQSSLRLMSLTEFLEMPGARSLIGILDGPSEAMGVIILSPEVLSGLIEVQTIGTVSEQPPMARKPTRTDAAMVAGFLDSALSELDMALAGQAEAIWAAGFRYASFLDDARALALMLEDTSWQVAEVEVSLAGGAKVGRVILALPSIGRGSKGTAEIAAQASKAAQFNADLREQIGHATASLEAILVRMQVDLAELLALGAEDVLPLFGASLDTVQIETLDGRRVATARLGQAQGMRALRILRIESEMPENAPIDPMLASAQSQFTPRGQSLLPAEHRNFVPEASADPASMSDLMSGLMSEIDEPFLPASDQGFEDQMAAGV
ncbi:MAG: FliM/FliN family flagellar motor switch protein [Paracoccaceae bacterium]